jgi:signal transduction histidine kinase
MLEVALGPGIELRIADGADAGSVFIDRAKVERILLNLVLNARDAMPGGGIISISIRESYRARDNGPERAYVMLEVGDSGSGMDEETRSRMFEPFFTTKGDHGTGLGLPIVNQIVAHAGGFIEVESEVGVGTRIRLHFPEIGRLV